MHRPIGSSYWPKFMDSKFFTWRFFARGTSGLSCCNGSCQLFWGFDVVMPLLDHRWWLVHDERDHRDSNFEENRGWYSIRPTGKPKHLFWKSIITLNARVVSMTAANFTYSTGKADRSAAGTILRPQIGSLGVLSVQISSKTEQKGITAGQPHIMASRCGTYGATSIGGVALLIKLGTHEWQPITMVKKPIAWDR